MNTDRQHNRTGGGGRCGSRRFVSIELPDPNAGIANALRSSFHVTTQDLPPDMMALLRKLDYF